MLEQYKKTVIPMQLLTVVVTAAMFMLSHRVNVALVFFFTMQFAALVGASWAVRLKTKVERGLLKVR